MYNLMNKIANPVMKWLLRSPFHTLLSKHLLLISVTGRKTHNVYTTPVQYSRKDDTVTIISMQHRTWWENLREQAPVKLILNGEEVKGIARAFTDDNHIKEALHILFPHMASQQLEKFAVGKIAINVQLQH